jgi:putative heme-binding domain-containing protein
VDVKFGPDGALYLCDWCNPIIGHYQASFRHPDRDKTRGRIWRVTAKGRPLTKPPRLADAPVAELLEHLKSSDRWTRRFAKRVLADRPTEQVTAALAGWIARPGLSEHALVEALGVYQSHEIVAPDLLRRLCQAANPGARAYAAGVVGAWADRLPDPLALLQTLVTDENPRVRLQAVVACTWVPKAESMELAARAADLPTDKFLAYALNQAVFALKPYWLPAFKAGKLNLDNETSRLGLLVRADGTPDTLQTVRDLVSSERVDLAARETYLRILVEVGDSTDLSAILKLTDTALQARLLPALATATRMRNLRPSGDLVEPLRPLIHGPNTEVRHAALKLAGVWKLEAFRSITETLASNAGADITSRRAAVEALASFGGESGRTTLARLAADGPPAVRAVAVAALVQFDLAAAAKKAAGWFSDAAAISSSPVQAGKGESSSRDADVGEIFAAFIRRKGGAAALANALVSAPPPKPVAEVGLRLMSSSGRYDEQLARVLTDAAGLSARGIRLAAGELDAFAAEVRARGDPKRGAEIFRRPELGCVACHAVNGQGGRIGPDLSALGTAQPVDFIIGAILDPQKEIKEGYMSLSVITKEGEEYQGYLLRETGDELVLRDALQNTDIRLRRDTIGERRQHGSVMPAGLVDLLTEADLRDLVRYLSELGRPGR